MDVDMRSPPMRHRATSNKRARSPGSPVPAERLTKRPLIMTHETAPNNLWDSGYLSAKRKSVHEDEWLDQTRDLSIHSPALSNTDDIDRFESDLKGLHRHLTHEDIQMNSQETDGGSHPTLQHHGDDSFVTNHDSNAEPTSLTTPTSRQSNTTMRHQQLTALHLALPSQTDNMACSLAPRTAPPHITLHPATPATPTDAVRASTLTLPLSPTPMAVECSPTTPSSTYGWRPGGQKKRSAVSMGPRADCEKCRLKVPGHWMHFD